MAKYVLQMREHSWTKTWITLGQEFDSLDEAKAALAKRSPQSYYRIAEAYTVTRYKAVKL